MTAGIHLKANNKADTYSEPLSDLVKQLISVNEKLRIESTTTNEKVKRANELMFKTFNIEHTGHNIAGGR